MAVDLDEATRRHFPVRNCAQTLLRRLSSEDPQNLHIMVDNTRFVFIVRSYIKKKMFEKSYELFL